MESIEARSIFSPATGYIRRGGFDFTCNPFVGCTFGCKYCYAMYLPQNRRPRELWGKWFMAKRNAVELSKKELPKVVGKALYMSSVTDPYQPAERTLELTRGILKQLVSAQPRLVIQTRSNLVTRDLDLLTKLHSVRVNMTLGSDSENVREILEPKSPPYEKRWAAARELAQAGVPIGLCLTPVLPIQDVDSFVDKVADLNAQVVVIQAFHDAAGAFGADTSPEALAKVEGMKWTPEHYRDFAEKLRRKVRVYEGEKGFFPPAAKSEPVRQPNLFETPNSHAE